ncbi:hypothetical protein T492DRAFT_915826 [Pavlovales sp. CCMP2436]|nr:hypothetical protein T492DRAFT_915826 [Pavlovales sp. CCMP2436]
MTNVLVLAYDGNGAGASGSASDAPSRVASDSGLPWIALEAVLPAAAIYSLPAHALRYAALRQVLRAGVSALLLEPTVAIVTDPFKALYRDSDIEAMAAGWDEPSAYGYNHVLDDESMGFTRYCHGSRIIGKDTAALFALATADSERLAWTLVKRMREVPGKPERELLSEELCTFVRVCL